jgi:hypothetical protein
MILALWRLVAAHHRQVADDSPTAEAVKLVARAHQSLVWDRTRQVLRLRSALGTRAYYQVLRQRGTGHQAALRQLSNRLVGILHGCLKNGSRYNEATAWAHPQPAS